MGELISERIKRNARELKLFGIAETADELVDRAETTKLGYREFLDLVLESEVGSARRTPLRLPAEALGATAPQDAGRVRHLIPARARPETDRRAAVAAVHRTAGLLAYLWARPALGKVTWRWGRRWKR